MTTIPLDRSDVVNLGLVAVTALVGLALWSRLPESMAVHFTASGTPDRYVSRPVGVFLVPAIMLATLVLMRSAVRIDPPADRRTATVTTTATMGLLSAVHLFVMAWNLGYSVPFAPVIVGILLWAAVIAGYAIVRERGLSLG